MIGLVKLDREGNVFAGCFDGVHVSFHEMTRPVAQVLDLIVLFRDLDLG
jgi:hypothetical protein